MSKTIIKKLSVTEHLDKVFKQLPTNANIDKGRCGIGGTTLEIRTNRKAIVIVCSLGGIICKSDEHPNVFPVYGKVKPADIIPILQNGISDQKIFVTPDSFWKIIEASEQIKSLVELYEDYFVLYDEAHTAITERWRPKVLHPLKWFWNFKNKSLISATPCKFTAPEFKQLQDYKIEFFEPYIGTVNVVECKQVEACVDMHIKNADAFPNGLFFFYNSVTEITDAIKRNKLTNCNIYCADKEDNYEKLHEQLICFKHKPETDRYNKINFFTTRYFESFDLNADNSTMILVTDVKKAHTKVGITNKGVQALGRLRKPAYKMIHITNHRNILTMKEENSFREEYQVHKTLIPMYNTYVEGCKIEGIVPLDEAKGAIKAFTEIDEKTHLATFDQDKLDQIVNELVCNEEYNHYTFIIDAWERSKYKVEFTEHSQPPKVASNTRLSKAGKLKQALEEIHHLVCNKGLGTLDISARELERIKETSPLAYEVYFNLGMAEAERLAYNELKIKEALLRQHNANAKQKLLPILEQEFNVGKPYSNQDILSRLQYLYRLVNLKKKDGTIETAKLTDLERENWFRISECKLQTNKGKVNGSIILECCFSVRVAC